MHDAFKLAPHEWAQLRALLDEAIALPPAERRTWVDRLDDARHGALKPRLHNLLAHASDAVASAPDTLERLLDTLPKVETDQFAPLLGNSVAPAERIGPYRLVRELGSGGMASVWLAERSDMLQRRQVALKLPHGAWRRAGLAERMAREREILATLEHPNIARLYDAGVAEDGQPFMALEYVEGERIDVWCERQSLDVPARLRLFLQVARAVAYAHAQLVVHRDLKPSNILVTADGQAKLLDFGIAKLLDQGAVVETELTQQSGRALTPDYAAPEQILGKPIGTAADVYALGVVLFELLAGKRPYQLKRDTRAALEEAILHADVPRPSSSAPQARRRALRGDLDTIILKALKPEPGDRYSTVAGLAEDIERHLLLQPVLAQPDSAWYRLTKFARRNRFQLGSAVALMVTVLAGTAVSVWQSIEARRERDSALQQQRRAQAYGEFMRMLLQDAGRADQPVTPNQLLDRGVTMLERRYSGDDVLAASMWYELSRSHLLFVQADRELALLDRSAAAARRVGDTDQLAASECSAAWTLLLRDRERGRARLQAGQQALAATRNPSRPAQADCARAEARWLQMNGKLDDAIALLEQHRARLQDRGASHRGSDVTATQLSDLYRAAERYAEATVLSERALQDVYDNGRQGSLAELVYLNNHAGNLFRMGEFRAAAEFYDRAAAWAERPELAAVAPRGVRTNAAYSALRLGQPERALALAESDVPLTRGGGNPTGTGFTHLAIARAHIALGRPDAAARALDQAEALWALDPRVNARHLREVATDRAALLLLRGDADAAAAHIRATLLAVGYPPDAGAAGIDRLLREAARIELQRAQFAQAEQYAADALQKARQIARAAQRSGDVGLAMMLRAQARDGLGRRAEALAELREAVLPLRNGFGDDHPETRRALALIAAWGG